MSAIKTELWALKEVGSLSSSVLSRDAAMCTQTRRTRGDTSSATAPIAEESTMLSANVFDVQ